MPTRSWLRQAAVCVGLQGAKIVMFGSSYKEKSGGIGKEI
jgi:hypothetical protein